MKRDPAITELKSTPTVTGRRIRKSEARLRETAYENRPMIDIARLLNCR
jgi:hypothetical protein